MDEQQPQINQEQELDRLRKKVKLIRIAIALFILFILVQAGFWVYIIKNIPILTGENACKTCQERLGYVCKPEIFSINLTNNNEKVNLTKFMQNGT